MSKLAKSNLRRAIKSQLNKLCDNAHADQSRIVYDAVISHKAFHEARFVALFMSMPKLEVNTDSIIEYCFRSGKKVFFPKCAPSRNGCNDMTFLSLGSMDEVSSLLPTGKYNLREPSHGDNVMVLGDLDLILVPGVAFTHSGDRLGHGAGYYDRFLKIYHEKFGKVPFLMGVCLADQLVESIPTEPHDWKMDHIIAGNSEG